MLFLSLIHICPYIYVCIYKDNGVQQFHIFLFVYIYSISSGSHPFLQFVPSVSVQYISWVSYCFCLQCCWRFTPLLFYVIVWQRTYIHFIRFDFDHSWRRSFMSRMLGHWSDCHARTGTVACHDLGSPTMPYTEEP